MSEEINFTDSNLTTTEDVFEEFQANTVYEEEDFITLADIAPPEDGISDLKADITEIPYDNEVVLSASQDELSCGAQNETCSTNTNGEEKPGNDMNKCKSKFQNEDELIKETSESKMEVSEGRPKRSRRTTAGFYSMLNDNSQESSTQYEKKRQSRRGTRPTNKQNLDTVNGNQTESDQTPDLVKRTPSKRGGRRGRGRGRGKRGKSLSGPTNISMTQAEDLDSEEIQHISIKEESDTSTKNMLLDNESPAPIEPVRRRGKKKKMELNHDEKSTDETVTEQIENEEDVTQKTIPKDSEQKNQTTLRGSESFVDSFANFVKEKSNFTDIPSTDKKQKKTSKKKQKHKTLRDETTVNSETKLSTELNMSDEDNDDVSLSNLKKSFENRVINDPTVDVNINKEMTFVDEPIDVVSIDSVQESTQNEVYSDIKVETVESETKTEDIEENLNKDVVNDLLLEKDPSKRPARRKAKKTFHYEEESDEDPFANIELSDDDEPRRGKKNKYNDDEEYVPYSEPRKRGKHNVSTDDSGSDIDDLEGIAKYAKKKRLFSTGSPRKRSKLSESKKDTDIKTGLLAVKTIEPNGDGLEDDIEGCLQSSVIKVNDENEGSGFENFLAQRMQGTNLKIKKVSSTEPTLSLEIPVIDPNETKKFEDSSVQTESVKKLEKGAQTDSLHDAVMKINHVLNNEQAEKACEFLKGVVQTTSELGQLMTQKSEDFMKKKINTTHITDTFKMDYCVKKSFLLFKLAKHNLTQMEEDLAKQYEKFLESNGLENCREKDKKIEPKKITKGDDSDCEIVETPVTEKPSKAKFNPKTVFLNKELSIKIAKKPTVSLNKPTKGNFNIKGVVQKTIEKNTVWISESVMVKKVKPTQSFLATDSRNKKPPDSFVTEKMVSDFFKQYYYEQAQLICAHFTKPEWLCPKAEQLQCYYFFLKSDENASLPNDQLHEETVNDKLENIRALSECIDLSIPETLFSLCTKVLQKRMFLINGEITKTCQRGNCLKIIQEPASLFRLCVNKLTKDVDITKNNEPMKNFDQETDTNIESDIDESSLDVQVEQISSLSDDPTSNKQNLIHNAKPLKWLCHRKIIDLLNINESEISIPSNTFHCNWRDDHLAFWHSYNENCDNITQTKTNNFSVMKKNEEICQNNIVQPLGCLCYNSIIKILYPLKIQLRTEYSIKTDLDSDESIGNNNLHKIHDLQIDNAKKLKTLCYQRIKELIFTQTEDLHSLDILADTKEINHEILTHIEYEYVKSLNLIALENIQYLLRESKKVNRTTKPIVKVVYKVKPLADICFEVVSKITACGNDSTVGELTINSVNTLSEEAFHNIGEVTIGLEEECEFAEEETNLYDEDNYDAAFNNYEEENMPEENNTDENNWVAQVEMKLLSSFNSLKSCQKENEVQNQSDSSFNPEISRVKVEPIDEPPDTVSDNIETTTYAVNSSVVKNEPMLSEDQMTVIHDSVVTKREHLEDDVDSLTRPGGYDINQFESFVNANKMIHAGEYLDAGDEIFSQSGLRVRRQYDPDSDHEEPDTYSQMSLLVPQTFEPLRVENAKDCLMESSSDESTSKKSAGKKKTEKRGKGRPRKNEQVVKDKAPPPPPPLSEVAKLTRRMKERIRQEEKKIESSDSETEISLPLNMRREKDQERKGNEKTKSKSSNVSDDEIQCNNVDSTEQIENNDSVVNNSFTGFSAVDQTEITSYQKYVNFVYDKIMPKVSDAEPGTSVNTNEISSHVAERSSSPLIHPDAPVEMIECVPTMPMFDNFERKPAGKRGRPGPKSKTNQIKDAQKTEKQISNEIKDAQKSEKQILDKSKDKSEPAFVERNGWHCYPIDNSDGKLFQLPSLPLEKLPESFVQTYFRYQNITNIREEDHEVNKLVNLQTLKKSTKDVKRLQNTKQKQTNSDQGSKPSSDISRAASPERDLGENAAELTPSEDENNVEDEVPPAVPLRQNTTENHLAKNSLMNDESDEETPIPKIKQEKEDDNDIQQAKPQTKKKTKASPIKPENLMLTADKMMNKELNLLHAPVNLDNSVEASTSGTSGKNRHKKGSKRDRTRGPHNEEDSSSEEEKQWVSTKEKLLKRMGKKQDTTIVDDAKRAKLVNEFIERRGDGGSRKRHLGRGKKKATRMMLEREKQLRVLSKELYGDGVDLDSASRRKIVSHSLFKGRRNIRKVIDKKSLARSTVIANMEEFERKRRLIQKLQRMREVLGCEEDVNVLVINGEVCLEYDFEHHRPLVTVHPFFTKVMKSHQYEGVKFMWDACFESLEMIESGHPGGGCILAHCMGLGKTLQVLALLHTVLTHPRVGMQRVLVCCPLSTVLNWVDEIHKWIGPVTDQIKVFELSKLKKTYERAYQLEDWYNGGGIFIIGYELFRSLTTLDPLLDDVRPTIVNKIRSALLNPGPDIVVCDEGHLLKNDCSVLAVAMSRVQTKRRIVLTGTPMQNNLREYYCMVNFVKPNLLGTYSEYSNRFENPIMNGQHRDSRDEDIKLMKQRTHILHKVLEGCLQRQEASVLYPYLPKKHEYTLFISLTKCQWDLYKHYMKTYANQSKASILKDFHTLQKIWSHPQVLHNFQMRTRDEPDIRNKIKSEKLEDDLATEDLTATEDIKPSDTEVWWLPYLDGGKQLDSLESSNKFLIVFRILEECIKLGDKVLIFSTSLITMDSLEFFLKKINKWKLGQEYYRLDGSVPAEVRQKWCREFNAEHNVKTKLFLISTRAGSLGLNMVAANRVIILDTSWNPAHDIQSIFRVYRFGQKKDCYIYRLVALGTMEQKIYERAVTKQAVACRVVDEQQIDRHYNSAELTELYKYDEHGSGVECGVAVGVCDVALLRVARAPCLHAVHEHDSLLRGSTEQQLTELERRDAWLQFQEEHKHKQIQNQLTSSFALHISTNVSEDQKNVNIPALGAPPYRMQLSTSAGGGVGKVEVKTEPEQSGAAVNAPCKPEPKGKKGKKKITIAPAPPKTVAPEKEELPVEENVVKKIMKLLVKYNIHNHQEPKEIAALISNVRKIVAYGQMPKDGFNCELTQSIANVLLGKDNKEPPSPVLPPPLTNVAPNLTEHTTPWTSGPQKRKGRKTMNSTPVIEPPGSSQDTSIVPDIHPSPLPGTNAVETPKSGEITKMSPKSKGRPKKHKGRPRSKKLATVETATQEVAAPSVEDTERPKRKAALAAEKQLEDIVDDCNIIDLGDDDWQADDNNVQLTRPPKQVSKKDKDIKINQTKKQLESDVNSILLSDDDEPQQPEKVAKTDAKSSKSKEKGESVNIKSELQSEEIVPLHPSLLSNKNFIKIVAHTYLEGNPMLDEDAALLAAQYSTQKALKEYEATGVNIESGPIYDIAKKVLGIDILKKLHKTNPSMKKTEESAPETSQKPQEPKPQRPSEPVKTEAIEVEPKVEERPRPGPRSKVKLKGLSELMPQRPPPPPVPSPLSLTGKTTTTKFAVAQNTVVPVGLIQRSVSITPDEPEESILPDDEVRIVTDSPTPPRPAVPVQKPIILNGTLSRRGKPLMKTIKMTTDGKLVMEAPRVTANDVNVNSAAVATVPTGDTICLDSDEEDTAPSAPAPPSPAPTGKLKRVALKSTAKKQPVPVSVTAATPLFANILPKPTPYLPLSKPIVQQTPAPTPNIQNLDPPEPQQGYVLFPQGNKFIRLNFPRVTAPPVLQSMTSNVNTSAYINPTANLQIPNYAPTSMPQVVYATHSVPSQNVGYVNQNMQPMYSGAIPQNVMSAVPQNINMMNTANQMMAPTGMLGEHGMAQYGTVPSQAPPAAPAAAPPPPAPIPQAPKPASTTPAQPPKGKPTKTVCKPGDILRITKTGQVEILNRDQDESPTKEVEEPLARVKSPEIQRKRKSRIRKISTSSSSDSDEAPDDPLSILKDVVHIKAVDDDHIETSVEKNKSVSKDNTPVKKHDFTPKSLIGSTSIVKSALKSSSKPTTPQKGPECTIKKVDKRLLPASKTVDLTDFDMPSTSKVAKPNLQQKPTSSLQAVKNKPSKITGKSKDIIINSSGKALSTASTEASGKKAIKVTNVETLPALATPAKTYANKRPAPSFTDTATAKKPKPLPMTLKDFDIDDIDDIIELD